MIKLHKINGAEFYLNHNLIEKIEVTHDTVISLTNERKYVVKEGADEIIGMIVSFEKNVSLIRHVVSEEKNDL